MDHATAGRPVSRRTVLKGAGLSVAGAAVAGLLPARASRADAMPPGVRFYVSPDGDDGDDGSIRAPFATLEAARDAIRALRSSSGLPAGGASVYLRGGRHVRSSTFVLESQDSGTEQSPISYRGYRDEVAEIVGSVVLDGRAFTAVTDQAVLARLSPSVRDTVRQISLPAHGITDFGGLADPGIAVYPASATTPPPQLIFDDAWMTLARWPDTGYVKMGEILNDGTTGQPLQFRYTDDHPSHWASVDDTWIFAYPKYSWAFQDLRIASVDAATSTITCAVGTAYGAVTGARYYYFNVLEELDSPGEWYLDRSSGMLYLYPPAPLGAGSVRLTQLDAPLVTMDSVDHVTFAGLTFAESRSTAIVSQGGSDNCVSSCTFALLGGRAVLFAGGYRNGVMDSEIHDVGIGGVVIDSGDRPTLMPGNGYVENNRIHAFSQWQIDDSPAVQVLGVGNRMAHNEIYDGPHMAVLFYGNDHVFEYNEIHHVMSDTQDTGAIYAGRDWTIQGNVIRYNHLHDINNRLSQLPRSDGTQAGIYLDDGVGGTYIYGNVFERVATSILLHGGRNNVVDNNLILDCDQPIWMTDIGADLLPTLEQLLAQMPYEQPPWSARYPALLTIESDGPTVMKYNTVIRTVTAGSGPSAYSADALQYGTLEDNWTSDSGDVGLLDIGGGCYYPRAGSPIFAHVPDFEILPAGLVGPFADRAASGRLAEAVAAFTNAGDVSGRLSTQLAGIVEQLERALASRTAGSAAACLARFVFATRTGIERGTCSPTAGTALVRIAESLSASVSGDSFQDVTAHATKSAIAVGDSVGVWAMGDMLSGRYVNVFPAHTLTSLTPQVAKTGPNDTAVGLSSGQARLRVAARKDRTARAGVTEVPVFAALLGAITVDAGTHLLSAGGSTTTLGVSATLTNGSPVTLAPTDITFSTSDATVATVDANGTVTPVAEGIATITVTASQNGISADASFGLVVAPAQATLPAGWSVSNFGHTIHGGTVATQGAASYDNGVWWVATDGANIWFDTDDCTFLHQELPGVTDVTISATIQGGTGGQYAGYGLLIRDGDADGANEVSWRSQQGGSLTVQYRNADNPDSWYMGFPSSPLPVQLRLQKRGDLFTAYQFQGGSWVSMGSVTVPMGPNLRVGIGVFADASLVAEVTCSDVVVSTP